MKKEVKDKLDKWVSREYEWFKGEVGTNITWGKMSQYTEDLVHHILSDLYKVKDEQIEEMLENGKIKGWVLRAASLQIRSNTSPFYSTFRKHKLSARSGIIDSNNGNTYDSGYEMDVDNEEELMDCFEKAVDNLHWYQKTIFNKKFKEGKTLQEVYEYYNISKNHLIKDLNKAIEEIREKCKHIN